VKAGPLPLSVWATAQRTSQVQRRGRYLPASMAHPAKMLPAVAAAAVEAYTAPGDLVVDPMCGIGTTLVEAAHLGRDAFGVEYEPRWAQLARANLAHARARGASGSARVATGDGRRLASLLGAERRGTAALVLTSPPYGPSLHGRVEKRPGGGIGKRDDRYSDDRTNLGRVGLRPLLTALEEILVACAAVLRADGLVVLTTRPWRRQGELVDFPSEVVRVAEGAGLVLFERNVALLAGLSGDRLVSRASFFQLDAARKARARGIPRLVIAHEDVLVFRRP